MAAKQHGPALVWFRQDLRLTDQPALRAASADGRPVAPVYVLDDAAAGRWALGGAARWWLHFSLQSLDASLQRVGAPLVLRRGSAVTVLPALMDEIGATELHAGLMHEPWGREQETGLRVVLGDRLRLHRTTTLTGLDQRTKTGGTYGVYGPFARQLRAGGAPRPPEPAPARLYPAPVPPRSERLEDWGLLPSRPDWAGGLRDTWRPGETAAHERLQDFAARAAAAYHLGRNVPGDDLTSMLSPRLHWGELSPGQVWHAAAGDGEGIPVFQGELLWREFSAYLLFHNPALPTEPLRPRFAALPTRTSRRELQAWQRGRTGVPIVDAGMRQLWHTGWMHNRVRMIAASFLVKHLLMPWQEGEQWFWDTLVDADLASNAASWQWVAGTGIDSQPFFRVFNPVSQGEKFDRAGAYVRRWVPELARLPDRWIHAPWSAPATALSEAGVVLGRTYPTPVVDLSEGRRRALAAYRDTVRTAAA